MPYVPNEIFPGSAFAAAIRSATDVQLRFRIDHDDVECAGNQRHGRKIAMHIVWQSCDQARIDRAGKRSHQQRVAVRLAGHDRLRSDDGAGARLVLDDHAGTEILCHFLRQHPRDRIGATARRLRHHDPDDALGEGGERRPAGGRCRSTTWPRAAERETMLRSVVKHHQIIRATNGIFRSHTVSSQLPPSVTANTIAALTAAGHAGS